MSYYPYYYYPYYSRYFSFYTGPIPHTFILTLPSISSPNSDGQGLRLISLPPGSEGPELRLILSLKAP
jgi:hypothetical protein